MRRSRPSVYEGVSVGGVTIAKGKPLEVVLVSSDGQPLVAVSKAPKRRVVIDCGATRYWYSPAAFQNVIDKTAGGLRLGENVAAYLAGKDAPRKP